MEEDIKVLEQFLKANNRCVGCEEKCNDCYIEYEEVQAVANLIKGYRELEENLKIATAMLTKGSYPSKNEDDNDFNKQFIPKSKIKEALEENKKLKKEYEAEYTGISKDFYFDYGRVSGKIELANKLLEEQYEKI